MQEIRKYYTKRAVMQKSKQTDDRGCFDAEDSSSDMVLSVKRF